MKQKWHDLLFMHWPVAANQLRHLIPAELEIETCEQSAWIGIVPFRMSAIRLRGLPPFPCHAAMPEVNVRTYVRAEGKPGVWFFSLDTTKKLAVMAARRFFHLPYFRAKMSCKPDGHSGIRYASRRLQSASGPIEFRGRYRPTGEISHARRGSLEYFLTERYCLYAVAKGRIFRSEIDHGPWPLQPAEAEVETNTMAAPLGIALPSTRPLLHFAAFQDVRIWRLRRLG